MSSHKQVFERFHPCASLSPRCLHRNRLAGKFPLECTTVGASLSELQASSLRDSTGCRATRSLPHTASRWFHPHNTGEHSVASALSLICETTAKKTPKGNDAPVRSPSNLCTSGILKTTKIVPYTQRDQTLPQRGPCRCSGGRRLAEKTLRQEGTPPSCWY
eukprot:Blabericola_migrator_1__1044@NODE_1265_length_4943_cov_40_633101_g403_i1_p4_GENE_NODE_1265_length_4943_cov_40_633101_g403_i1NODE_1265_length_4943_cov_40_633101_g403_i1_p4_ORF_typecomplete_len161_score0_04Pdase_C33_assoc/PF14756_6/0_13_NODE_1265_length_4943_cov_40_633101_g403_i143494831